MSVKTLLVGWDGATFTVLNELMAQGMMPFLKSFLADGTRAKLRTIVPALTPPAWTSLMTGRTPGYHGVFDFFRFEGENSKHIRFATSSDVLTENDLEPGLEERHESGRDEFSFDVPGAAHFRLRGAGLGALAADAAGKLAEGPVRSPE